VFDLTIGFIIARFSAALVSL